MPAPLTIPKLDDGAIDLDHIAEVANSLELTAIDRLGHTKDTLAGAMYKIGGITDRGAWTALTVYNTKDIVLTGGTWYVCVVAHISSALFATDSASKWRVYQGVTTGDLSATSGAALVGFQQIGTGAGARDAQSKMRERLTPEDFGAVGNGIADDTNPLINAFTALANGGTLEFGRGKTYKVTSAIAFTFANGARVRIIGNGACIDGSSVAGAVAGDTTLITLGGQRLTSSLLSASPAKGDTSITTAASNAAAANEIVLITSTDLWNPTRVYYYKGELAQIRSASGAPTYTLSAPLFDGYTAATTTVYRLAMPTVEVEGLEVKMNANQLGLALTYCRNPRVTNCTAHGARYTGIRFAYCYGGTIDSNLVYDSWYAGTGTSYNIEISSSQGVVVGKNTLREARHNISAGGNEPCRNLLYRDNNCFGHPSEALLGTLDLHGNTELCVIENNFCEGISVSGKNTVIRGNTVISNRVNSTLLNIYQEINSDYYVVKDNIGIGIAAGIIGLWMSPSVAGLSVGKLEVTGNQIQATERACLLQPRSAAASGCSIDTARLERNSFTTTGVAVAFVVNVAGGVTTYSISRLLSLGNFFRGEVYDAFYIVSGNPVAVFRSEGDHFLGNRLNGYLVQVAGTDVYFDNPWFEGNINGAGVSRSVRYINTGKAYCRNPVVKNLTYGAELDTGGPTEYVESGRTGTTTATLNTAAARLLVSYQSSGRALAYGTAAPVARTWAVGDRVVNQSPAVGSPKAWVCTVAGTPGTWVSEGNL